jgi:hypothetical protein
VQTFSVAVAQAEETASILNLQDQNHVSALPTETLASGFVTTQLSPETLAKMREQSGVWTARATDGTLAGYACANGWNFYGDGPFQRAAKALLPLNLDGHYVTAENSFQYGPVCVAHDFRGQGVLEQLVGTIKEHHAPRFEFGITFIDVRNERSLSAHERKLGFRRLALLPFDTATYHLLAFTSRAAI